MELHSAIDQRLLLGFGLDSFQRWSISPLHSAGMAISFSALTSRRMPRSSITGAPRKPAYPHPPPRHKSRLATRKVVVEVGSIVFPSRVSTLTIFALGSTSLFLPSFVVSSQFRVNETLIPLGRSAP